LASPQVQATPAENQFMRPKTRLDPVIKLEEQKEERKLAEMAAAGRQVRSAEQTLADARSRAEADHRRAATAIDWQITEMAHARALVDVHNAERAVSHAHAVATTSREAYRVVHSKAEALRRVAATRVEEILMARAKAEAKELDELGVLTFNIRPRAA
jgi:flagellar export protein FliJ